MGSSLKVGVLAALAAAALAVCASTGPVPAMASPAVPLGVPSSFSGTLSPNPLPTLWMNLPPRPLSYFFFSIDLGRGQTVEASVTTAPDVEDVGFTASAPGSPYFIVSGRSPGPVQTIAVSGEASETCYMLISASTSATFTLSLAVVPTQGVFLSQLSAPRTAKRRKAFVVSASLSDYSGFHSPVRFMIDRKVGGKWRPYSSAKGVEFYGARWKYVAGLRLPRGTFRVRARFRDAGHLASQYDSWRTVLVR